MKLAVGAGRLYIYCPAGEVLQPSRGTGKQQDCGPAARGEARAPALLLRLAGPALLLLPGGERQRRLDDLWKFPVTSSSHCRHTTGPTKVESASLIQAGAFPCGTRAHFLGVGGVGRKELA